MKFEDLVRILEEEKKSTLSRIAHDFYSTVQEYIKELEEADRKISRRHSEESIMIQYELKNALSTVDKIFNRRTRKIIKMASGKAFSKNPTNITHDIENMTPEEKQVYQQVLDAILSGKKNTIEPILGTSIENEPGIEPEIKSDIKPNIQPDIEPGIKPEIKSDIKPNIQPDIEPGIKPDSKSDIKPNIQPDIESDIKPEIKSGIKPDSKSDIESGIKPNSKPDIKSDIEPDITTPVQDTDEHVVQEGNTGDEVSRPKPTESRTISGVSDQGTINEKQDVSKVPAADNTPVTEKSSLQETETQITPSPTHEEKMGRDSDENGKKDLNKEYIVVRLLKNIPKFIGADGRNYRLGAQDVAVLPEVNAKALIKRKVAVQIEST
jgi:DNA replication initiation complex subunit (GINS family)